MSPDFAALDAHYATARAMLGWSDGRFFGRVPERSGWSPAEHLWHTEAAARGVLAAIVAIQRGRAAAAEVSLRATAFLSVGEISRGRSQAPATATPPDGLTREAVEALVGKNAAAWARLRDEAEGLPAIPGTVDHPLLGPLRAADWVRFAGIHAAHHDAIAAEVAAE